MLNLDTRVQDTRQQAFLSYNLKNCQETAPFLFALGTAGIPFLDDDRNCCYTPTSFQPMSSLPHADSSTCMTQAANQE